MAVVDAKLCCNADKVACETTFNLRAVGGHTYACIQILPLAVLCCMLDF